MSLHTLANHLQSAGRGDDKLLVHMTPGEVHGLQSLAMAHGGSLTINPETGLPEAGFLSSILPIVAGLALGPAGAGVAFGGLSSAASAGLLVGGATAVATGSLKNGILAGLGAYGGAGLGAGLSGAAAAAPGLAGAGAAAPLTIAQQAGQGALATGMSGAATGVGAGTAAATPNVLGAATNPNLGGYALPQTQVAAAPVAPYGSQATFNAGVPQPTDLNALAQQRAFAQQMAQSSPTKVLEEAGKSKGIFGGMDFSKLMNPEFMKENKGNYLAAMAPFLMEEERRKQQLEQAAAPTQYGMARVVNPSARAPGSTAERTYFADGGLANLPVENMSQQNTVGANTNYPMANSKPYGYAVPKNYPVSQNVFQPESFERVDPYTGEQQFASGGIIALKSGGTPAPKSQAQIDEENAAKEYASYLKDRNADKAKAKAEMDARNKELTGEYTGKINSFNADTQKELKERQASIKAEKDKAAKAEMQKELNSWQQGRNSELANLKTEQTNAIKDRTGEYTNRVKELDSEIRERQALRTFDTDVFKKGYTGFSGDIKGDDLTALNKGYDTEIGKQKSEADAAKQALESAKKTGIQSLINRAQDTYNKQQGEYEESTKAKDSRIAQFKEETKRGSGLQARGFDTTAPADTASIDKRIKEIKANPQGEFSGMGQRALSKDQLSEIKSLQSEGSATKSGLVLDPATGKMVADKTPKSYQKLTKAPGLDGTVKILEEKDIRTVFEEMTGRSPSKAEIDKYLGGKSSQAALAKSLTDPKKGLAELQMAQKFTADDLNQQAVYYWGREMTPGELKYFQNPANKVSNFNVLRNMLTSDSKYLENLNKVNQTAFTSAQKAIQAETEGRASKKDIASYYQQVFNKAPSQEELDKFYNTGLNISALKEQIDSSPAYEKTLTQSFVPGIVPSGTTTGTQSLVPGITQDVSPYVTPALKPTASLLQDLPISQQTSGVYKYDPFAVSPKLTTENPTIPYADVSQKLGLIDLYSQLGQPSLTPQKTNYGVPTAQSGLTAPQENVFGFSPYPPGVEQAIKAYAAAQQAQAAQQAPTGMASGGVAGYNLGGYSDGGRLLRGPGDGVSDSIPASIGDRQPARLADGEFVVPARIVSELGNGSTEAGARKLYAMMERVQRARGKSIGSGKVAVNSRAEKMLPA